MFALGLLAATFFVSYGDTPARAFFHALYVPRGSRIVVEKVNVVGRYATVLSRGAVMEGFPVRAPILMERFTFGWQALEYVDSRCRLDDHVESVHAQRALLRGMPDPRNDRPCRANRLRDVGPTADVDAVRKEMQGPLVPGVTISNSFALGSWYGAGGGESLFRKVGSHWRPIARGGGALGTADMPSLGVPAANWCALGIYDAKCSKTH